MTLLNFSRAALLFSFTLFAGAPRAQARGFSTDKNYFVGAGLLNHMAGKTANDAKSTSKPFFQDIYTELSLTAIYEWNMDWSWSPTLYYGIQPKSSPDGQEKFSTSGFSVRALYHYTDALDLHVGLGVLSYKIAGSGGLVTQNNGSGSSTFASPSDSKTTSRYTLDLGSAYAAGDWRFDLSILVTGPFTTSKLALNPLFTVSMGFL